MIDQLAVPLVIVERDFTVFQILFSRLAFAPCLAAFQFIEFAVSFGVPGVEEFARIAGLNRLNNTRQ